MAVAEWVGWFWFISHMKGSATPSGRSAGMLVACAGAVVTMVLLERTWSAHAPDPVGARTVDTAPLSAIAQAWTSPFPVRSLFTSRSVDLHARPPARCAPAP